VSEILKLKFANWLNKKVEAKGEGKGLLFVPQDQRLREISEAMLLDGAKPSEINATVLDIWQEEHKQKPRILTTYHPVREVKFSDGE
jgi:hypothetical protein